MSLIQIICTNQAGLIVKELVKFVARFSLSDV